MPINSLLDDSAGVETSVIFEIANTRSSGSRSPLSKSTACISHWPLLKPAVSIQPLVCPTMRLAHTKSVAARRRNGLFSLAVFTQPSKLAAAITRPTKNAPMQENSKISLSTARIKSPLRERASALPEDGKKLAMNCHVLRQSRGSEDSRFNSKQYRGRWSLPEPPALPSLPVKQRRHHTVPAPLGTR